MFPLMLVVAVISVSSLTKTSYSLKLFLNFYLDFLFARIVRETKDFHRKIFVYNLSMKTHRV